MPSIDLGSGRFRISSAPWFLCSSHSIRTSSTRITDTEIPQCFYLSMMAGPQPRYASTQRHYHNTAIWPPTVSPVKDSATGNTPFPKGFVIASEHRTSRHHQPSSEVARDVRVDTRPGSNSSTKLSCLPWALMGLHTDASLPRCLVALSQGTLRRGLAGGRRLYCSSHRLCLKRGGNSDDACRLIPLLPYCSGETTPLSPASFFIDPFLVQAS